MQQLTAGNIILDLEKAISIPLNFKIQDIRDVEKRSGAFSKTITLPGTPTNNQFFGGNHDFNADTNQFNPNVKTSCVFSINGDEFINGHLQLKSITRNDKGHINYNVVLYDKVVDFWSKLDKKTFGDLDFSPFNHLYTKANIVASWANTWNSGSYYYANHFNRKAVQVTKDFRPAIFHKKLLDMIITNAGFTWSGNLKTNTIFEKEIIQSTIDRAEISDAEALSKTFRVEKSIDELVFTGVNPTGAEPLSTFDVILDDETTLPNQDVNNLWNSLNKMTATKAGLYKFIFNVATRLEYVYTSPSGSLAWGSAFHDNDVNFVVVIKNGGGIVQETIKRKFPSHNRVQLNPNQTINNGGTTRVRGTLNSKLTGSSIYMGAGWTVETFITIESTQLTNRNGSTNVPNFAITTKKLFVEDTSFFESAFLKYSYDDNVLLIFEDFVNLKYKQKDVIRDIMKRYNCFVYPNPNNANDIVFNVRDEFYQSGAIVDFSALKDHNTRDQIQLIGELQSEEMELTYSKGTDEFNKQYTNTVGDENVFGEYKFEFGNEFVKGKKVIKTPYNPTPLVFHGAIPGMVVPGIQSQQPIVGMRVLYASGIIEVGVIIWDFKYRTTAGAIVTDSVSGYGYAGHLDDPKNPTIDINFGELPFPNLYYQTVSTTNNTLFERHWRNTINQIADGKLVKTKMNLGANHAFFLKNNPNVRLFIDNKYYYVNKFSFEGNENLRKLTSLELITVEDDITVTPQQNTSQELGDFRRGLVGNFMDPGAYVDNSIENLDPTNSSGGSGNIISPDAVNVNFLSCKNCVIADGAENVFVQGCENLIVSGSNVTVINTSNLEITKDDITIINNIIHKDGKQIPIFNLVDGGRDALRQPFSPYDINRVDGQPDRLNDIFNVPIINRVDSDSGINTIL